MFRTLAFCLFAALSPVAASVEQGLVAQQSVEVKASPKAVWALVKNYDGLSQ